MTLGKYPALSLKQARELLLNAQRINEQGISPIDYQKHEKTKEIYTVEKLVNEWYEAYVVKNHKQPLQIKQQIQANIIPLLGEKELAKLQPLEIARALDVIVNRGAPILANRVLSSLKQAFNYAVSIRSKDIGGPENPGERVLTLEEVKTLWTFLDTDQSRMSIQVRNALKIITLTGVRTA